MVRMSRITSVCVLVLFFFCFPTLAGVQTAPGGAQKPQKNQAIPHLQAERSSRLDLEVGGNLKGQFQGSKAYLRRKDLLALPQVEFTVSNDPNFAGPVKVRGVELQVLARELAADGEQALIVAVCKDYYRGFYPQAYREIHKPVLVLEINGQPPLSWPKGKEGMALGPYVITHANFTPTYKILAHQEEAQIPWGVVRIEFQDEKTTFAAIAPPGPGAGSSDVQSGYHIAQQNCLRCHSASDERTKGTITWSTIGIMAMRSPQQFAAYVKNPQGVSPNSEMSANPEYDDATLQALITYFSTFAPPQKQQSAQ
jgi:cytochrome c2